MKIIDIHTHLSSSEYDADRQEMIERSLEECDFLIDIGSGTSIDVFRKSQELAEQKKQIYFTAGVHPHDAASAVKNSELLEEIRVITQHSKCVAIGECGFDYYYNHSTKTEQLEIFRWHRKLSEERGLPLMIHTRDAEEDTVRELQDFKGKAVFHCFTGTQALADFGISKGFFISFSGIVTFKNAEKLRQTFLSLPLEQIVIETDSPFLAPVPKRGKRNESGFIKYTAEFLSQLRGIPLQEFIDITSSNAMRLFNIQNKIS